MQLTMLDRWDSGLCDVHFLWISATTFGNSEPALRIPPVGAICGINSAFDWSPERVNGGLRKAESKNQAESEGRKRLSRSDYYFCCRHSSRTLLEYSDTHLHAVSGRNYRCTLHSSFLLFHDRAHLDNSAVGTLQLEGNKSSTERRFKSAISIFCRSFRSNVSYSLCRSGQLAYPFRIVGLDANLFSTFKKYL